MDRLRRLAKTRIQIKIAFMVFLFLAFQPIAHGESGRGDSTAIRTTIHTPRGTPVEALIYHETMSPVQISHLNDQWTTDPQYQDAEIVSDSTDTYNCHGYTWYMSEGGKDRVHIEYPQPYVEDGSFEIIEENEAAEGDKVLYGDGVHSAVIADEPGWAISKWGNGPLMRHRLRDIPPELGPDLKLTFYRKASIPAPPANLRIVVQ
jgi:hypothetical protein